MKKFTEHQKAIYSEIDKIIWEDWNPIGLKKEESIDEYESYVNQLFSLKINGANHTKITEYLMKSDYEIMGIKVDEKLFEKIATKIINI